MILIAVCAVMIGLAKTGIPGLGVLAIPLMAEVLGARVSVGVVLPMLMLGDVFAVIYYKHNAVWSHLLRLLVWTIPGVVIGYFAMGFISDQQLKPVIGAIILAILALNFIRSRNNPNSIPRGWWFAAGAGITAGITTIMANAAGPIVILYLLAMQLPKTEFVGTGAWYYLVLNWIKVPFSLSLGLITSVSLQLDFYLFPIIALGALAGVKILKRMSEKRFLVLVQVLTLIAALRLFF